MWPGVLSDISNAVLSCGRRDEFTKDGLNMKQK